MDFTAFATLQLVDSFSGPLKAISAQMGVAQAQSAALTGSMESLTKAMTPLTAGAAAVAGGLLAAALSTRETGKALGQLRSLGVEDMAALTQAGRDFSNNFSGTTTAQFLSSAYDIRSGISSLTDEGVAAMTRLSALTAKATISSPEQMSSLFATGYGIYKQQFTNLTDEQFGQVFSGAVSGAVQAFKTKGPALALAISNLGAAATNAGISMQEQFATVGMLQQTLPGERAGTAYGAFIRDAAKAGKELGLNFMDSNKQLRSFPEILDILHNKFGDTLDAAEKIKLQKAFSEESIRVVDLLYSKTGDLTSSIEKMRQAMGRGESLTMEMAQTMNNGLGSTITKTLQRIRNLSEMIGEVLAPTLTAIIASFSGVILGLQQIAASKTGQSVIRIAAAVSTAALAFASWTAMCWAASAALPYLAAMFAAMTWPVWLVLAAIATLALAWEANFGGMADWIKAWWGIAVLVVSGVVAVFETLNGSVGMIQGKLAEDVEAKGLFGLVTTVGKVVYRIAQFFGELSGGFASVSGGIGEVLFPVVASLGSALLPIGRAIGQVVAAIAGLSGSGVTTWAEFGQVVGIALGYSFRLLAMSIRIALVPVQILGELLGWVIGLFTGTGDSAQVVGNRIIGVFADVWQGLANLFPAMVEWLGSLNLFDSGVKLITTLAEGIISVIDIPSNLIRQGLQSVRDLLPFSDAKEGPLSTLTLSGRRLMETLGAGITAASSDLAGTVEGALAQAVEPVASPLPATEAQAEPSRSAGPGRQVVIRIGNLSLPGVGDSEGFIAQLQRLAEQYDVGGEVALA